MGWFDSVADAIQEAVKGIDASISTQPAPTQSGIGSAPAPVPAPSQPSAPVQASTPAPTQAASSAPATPQSLSRAIYTPSAIKQPSSWDALVHAAATGTNFNDVWHQMQQDYVKQVANSRWSPNQNIASSVANRYSNRPTIQEYEAHYNGTQQTPAMTPGAGPTVEAPAAHWFDNWGWFADGGAVGGISDTLPYVQRKDYHG